jgi:hypothetical protein
LQSNGIFLGSHSFSMRWSFMTFLFTASRWARDL